MIFTAKVGKNLDSHAFSARFLLTGKSLWCLPTSLKEIGENRPL